MVRGMDITKSKKSEDSRRMAAVIVSEVHSQLLGLGKILHMIHSQFQLESQAPDKFDKRWNSMAMG